jgi:hypothetical protein
MGEGDIATLLQMWLWISRALALYAMSPFVQLLVHGGALARAGEEKRNQNSIFFGRVRYRMFDIERCVVLVVAPVV